MQELIIYFLMENKGKATWTELRETYNLVSVVSMQGKSPDVL